MGLWLRSACDSTPHISQSIVLLIVRAYAYLLAAWGTKALF
jgi:hypothetical protein